MDAYKYQTPPRWWSPRLTPGRFRVCKFIRRRILVERGKGGKARTHALTEQLETSVQALLDDVND